MDEGRAWGVLGHELEDEVEGGGEVAVRDGFAEELHGGGEDSSGGVRAGEGAEAGAGVCVETGQPLLAVGDERLLQLVAGAEAGEENLGRAGVFGEEMAGEVEDADGGCELGTRMEGGAGISRASSRAETV